MTMSNDSFLTLPKGFGGRVRISPNSANSVMVDASSNSANGNDDDPRVCFVTYKGGDFTHLENWTRGDDGIWQPNSTKVTRRGSFGTADAPKTYKAAIIVMIQFALAEWYRTNDGAITLAEAEVRRAQFAYNLKAEKLADAVKALAAAQDEADMAGVALSTAKLTLATL